MYPIQEVDAVSAAFSTTVAHLMPAYLDIPEEFRLGHTKWNRMFSDWFFMGATNIKYTPKPGVESGKAMRHIKAIMGSFEPKHEHKEAAVAYLLSQWFDDVTYDRAVPTPGRR